MAPSTKQQITALVEGLMEIAPRRAPTLNSRMRLQRWLLRETAFFYPEVSLVEAVEQVISPMVATRYPH